MYFSPYDDVRKSKGRCCSVPEDVIKSPEVEDVVLSRLCPLCILSLSSSNIDALCAGKGSAGPLLLLPLPGRTPRLDESGSKSATRSYRFISSSDSSVSEGINILMLA